MGRWGFTWHSKAKEEGVQQLTMFDGDALGGQAIGKLLVKKRCWPREQSMIHAHRSHEQPMLVGHLLSDRSSLRGLCRANRTLQQRSETSHLPSGTRNLVSFQKAGQPYRCHQVLHLPRQSHKGYSITCWLTDKILGHHATAF